MSTREFFALRDFLEPNLKGRTLSDARQVVSLADIAGETCLQGRLGELLGRSVLLAVAVQLLSALAILMAWASAGWIATKAGWRGTSSRTSSKLQIFSTA